jgi:AcrR family transcriptional regulator
MPPRPTRLRILTAARRLFDAGGVDAVSIRQVAAKVGITPMAIYRHFADRDALIEAIVLDALDRWRDRVAALTPGDPLAWLVAAGDAFLDFALEEPSRFEAAFLVPSARARRIPDDFAAGRSPAGRFWLARLEELEGAGRLARGAEPLDVAFTLWALAQGLVTLHRAGRFAGDVGDFRAFYAKSIRRCLASFADTGDGTRDDANRASTSAKRGRARREFVGERRGKARRR